MSLNCKHCGELIVGNVYRVTSEEDGMILLNMVVCSLCAMEARREDFNCIWRKSILVAANFPFAIEKVTVRDSEFNCAGQR